LEKNRSITSDRKFFEISIEKITNIICYASNNWNEGGYCPFGGPLFWNSLDVKTRKIQKPNFGANFFKIFSLEHHKKNEWKIRNGKPFKKVQLKKPKIVWPRHR
jgi:hypothetical protein